MDNKLEASPAAGVGGGHAGVIAALACSIFFVRFDAYIVNIAMPTFVDLFKISVSQASWIALAYVLSQVSAVMLFGKLCNQVRLKSIFLLGMVVFTAASTLCGFSPGFWSLILFRSLQGIGGSMMLVSGFAGVLLYLPREKVGWGLSIMTTSGALGVLLGPVAGGLIISHFSWHWIFLVNLPLGVAAWLFCRRAIPEAPTPERKPGTVLDLPGLGLSAAALFLLVYTLNMGCEHGWTSGIIFACAVFSLLFGIAFVLREKRCRDPLLDMSLFSHRSFVMSLLSALAGFLMFFGGCFLLPFYLTQRGLTPEQVGFVMMIFAVVYIPIGLYAGPLSDTVSPRKISAGAMFAATLTGALFAATLGTGIACAVVYLVMLALSYGMFFAPINHCIMNFASPTNRGSISAVFNTVMNITMAMGIAVLETVYSEFQTDPVAGFRAAFALGAGFCLLAALMLALSREEKLAPVP